MIWNIFSRARHQQLGASELRGMSDRDLADIGIGRSEVQAVLAMCDAPPLPGAAAPVTSPGTGGRTAGSPAAFRGGLSAPGAACRLHRA